MGYIDVFGNDLDIFCDGIGLIVLLKMMRLRFLALRK